MPAELAVLEVLLDDTFEYYFVEDDDLPMFSMAAIIARRSLNRCQGYFEQTVPLYSVIPHAFREHHGCDDSWCAFKKDPSQYTHKDLPHGKPLHGESLRSALTSLFGEYSTDTVIKKLIPVANSQRNESLNSVVGSKDLKIPTYPPDENDQ